MENQLQGANISQSIIGIGLNVNQTTFPNLPGATSIKKLTGGDFELDQLLSILLNRLESDLIALSSGDLNNVLEEYEKYLYLKDTPAAFKRRDGSPLEGIIRGVSPVGLLQIEHTDGSVESFANKELQFPDGNI